MKLHEEKVIKALQLSAKSQTWNINIVFFTFPNFFSKLASDCCVIYIRGYIKHSLIASFGVWQNLIKTLFPSF